MLRTLLLISNLVILFSTGYIILLTLNRKTFIPFIQKIPLSYGLGLGAISLTTFLLGVFKLPLDLFAPPHNLTFHLASLFILFIYFNLKYSRSEKILADTNKQEDISLKKHHLTIAPLITFFITLNLFYIFYLSLKNDVYHWDAVAIISMKAKIFFYNNSLLDLDIPRASYPIMASLAQSWLCFNLGYWDNFLIKIFFPLALSSYLINHYYFLKAYTNQLWSFLGVALLLSGYFYIHHTTIGYIDVLLSFFNCTAITLLILWTKERKNDLLIIAAIFSGLTSFVKLEGGIYLIIHILLLLLILAHEKQASLKKIFKQFIIFLSVSLSIFFLFFIYKQSFGITAMASRLILDFSGSWQDKIANIYQAFFLSLFAGGNWNFLWLLLIFSGLSQPKRLNNNIVKYLFTTLMTFFLFYFAFLLFTKANIDYPTTLSRVTIHFYPLCPLLIIMLIAPLKKSQ